MLNAPLEGQHLTGYKVKETNWILKVQTYKQPCMNSEKGLFDDHKNGSQVKISMTELGKGQVPAHDVYLIMA